MTNIIIASLLLYIVIVYFQWTGATRRTAVHDRSSTGIRPGSSRLPRLRSTAAAAAAADKCGAASRISACRWCRVPATAATRVPRCYGGPATAARISRRSDGPAAARIPRRTTGPADEAATGDVTVLQNRQRHGRYYRWLSRIQEAGIADAAGPAADDGPADPVDAAARFRPADAVRAAAAAVFRARQQHAGVGRRAGAGRRSRRQAGDDVRRCDVDQLAGPVADT